MNCNRFIARILALAISLMLLIGSVSALSEGATGEVIMWGWADMWISVFDEYQQTNPNLKLTYVPVASEDFMSKFATALNSDTDVPDIAWMELGMRGKLLSLPDTWEKLEQQPYNLNRDEMLDFCIPLCTNAEGEILGIECGPAPAGIAYRRNLALQYFGTDDPEQLEAMFPDWDSLIAKGREIRDASNGSVYLFTGPGDVYDIVASQNNAPYVVDGKLNLREALLPALEMIQVMRDEELVDSITNWSPAWNASFSGQQHIFANCPLWMPAYVIKPNDPEGSGNWALMMPPDGAINQGGTLFGIPSKAKNKEGAWELIKWSIFSKEGAEVVRDKIAYISAYKPVYDDPNFYNTPDEFFGGQSLLQTFADLASKVTVRQIIPEDSVINESIKLGVNSMITGSSAEEALKIIEDEVLRKIPELQR